MYNGSGTYRGEEVPKTTETTEKKRNALLRLFLLCPVRHCLTLLAIVLIGAYFALRGSYSLMTWLSENLARPYHRAVAKLCDGLGFSVAGVLIAVLVIAVLVYIILSIVLLIRRPEKLRRLYRLIITPVTVCLAVYAGFCLLWGVYYYTSDFEAQSGLEAEPISTEQLQTVTAYFAGLANDYGEKVQRDDDGLFAEDMDAVFERSASLYDEVEELFPCLEGGSLHAKPFMFSRIMSYIRFTGFFFPFTGEANINIDSPSCFAPSTIAHELAHQRGVAAEDEANFVAVLASLESGDEVYCYSACLLAYTHLGNSLYSADYDAWLEVYSSLSEEVRADLSANNEYWSQFETPVSEVSDSVYTGFLQSYGQTLGLKSYGACVDLLVAYYYDLAKG